MKKHKFGIFGILMGFAVIYEIAYLFLMLFKGVTKPVTKLQEAIQKEQN